MSEIENKTHGPKQYTGILVVISLVLSILAILAAIVSVRRIETVQASPVCLIAAMSIPIVNVQ